MVRYVCNIESGADLENVAEEIYDALHPEIDETLKALNPGINMTRRYRFWAGSGKVTDQSGVGTMLHNLNEYSILVYYKPQEPIKRVIIETHIFTIERIQEVLNEKGSQLEVLNGEFIPNP